MAQEVQRLLARARVQISFDLYFLLKTLNQWMG